MSLLETQDIAASSLLQTPVRAIKLQH